MIVIKDHIAIDCMRRGGALLSEIFDTVITPRMKQGVTSLQVDNAVAHALVEAKMKSESLGYMGYKYATCISCNDEVVHGVPSEKKVFKSGDLVKVDVCASWNGYCVDMARSYFIGTPSKELLRLVDVARGALDIGIAKACVGTRLSDISAAIQREVEKHGYGVVRDFAGHGIGKRMHEEPEVPNFGKAGKGPVLQAGMTLAIEPMITERGYHVYIAPDGWTVKTRDRSLAAHVEDTVLITQDEPEVLTRSKGVVG
jgi:methionyl aminopeptidase